MTEQLGLNFDAPPPPSADGPEYPELPCAFGHLRDRALFHHCAACTAEVERACAAFEADVAAGRYDAEGFTPAERAKQRGERWTGKRR